MAHLLRSYGCFLFDLDSTFLDEVAENFARMANALGVDMIYFEGAERLQGDYWYYNPKVIRAFYDRPAHRGLLQAGSYAYYSWHLLARSVSADEHGDIRGYLDERSGWFETFARDLLPPLDIGWYDGYDSAATPDLFEYVLGATFGYGASMSFHVPVEGAARHPLARDILDCIVPYERLRIERRVDEEMRKRLRINTALVGRMDAERGEKLLGRREFRLVGEPGEGVFSSLWPTGCGARSGRWAGGRVGREGP